MKKNILVVFLLFLFTSSTVCAECIFPDDLPADPPKFEWVKEQIDQKLYGHDKELIKAWECPIAYPQLLIGGERTYILFYVYKRWGKNCYTEGMGVAGFTYKNGEWQIGKKLKVLDEDLEKFYPGLYTTFIWGKRYNWNEP